MSNKITNLLNDNLDVILAIIAVLIVAVLMVIAMITVLTVQSNERAIQSFANSCAYSCQAVGKTIKSIEIDNSWSCICQP